MPDLPPAAVERGARAQRAKEFAEQVAPGLPFACNGTLKDRVRVIELIVERFLCEPDVVEEALKDHDARIWGHVDPAQAALSFVDDVREALG